MAHGADAPTIRPMAAHRDELSRRKREVLSLVADGYATKEIAGRLGVTSWCIEKHLRQMFRRYAVPNRAALVRAAFRDGLLS